MLLAMLLAGPVLVATPSSPKTGAICKNPGTLLADKTASPARVRPLGDQPPAQHIPAVLRTDVDGCVKPVVVNTRVGKR